MAGLRSLELAGGIKALLPAVANAPQLESLDIWLNPGGVPLDTGGLECLTRLTSLGLERCGLAVPPEGLSSLAGLLELILSHNDDLGAAPAASWEPLRAATRLTRLILDGCDLRLLPPAVEQLPALRVSTGAYAWEGAGVGGGLRQVLLCSFCIVSYKLAQHPPTVAVPPCRA